MGAQLAHAVVALIARLARVPRVALVAGPLVAGPLAACSSSAPASQPVIAGSADPGARPAGPAPRIAWQEGDRPAPSFDLLRLPAVARRGELVVVPVIDNDGGRGNLNLRIEARDLRDQVVDQVVVLEANEYEVLVPDGQHAVPELDTRVTAANQKLTALHERHDLVAMQVFGAGDTFRQMPVEGDGLIVAFAADHQLRVRAKSGTLLASIDGTSWLPTPGPRCAQCPPCENPAALAAFYRAPGIDTIVAKIAFSGTDTCWEPPDQWHVVGW